MESRAKSGFSGTQGARSQEKDDRAGTPRPARICDVVLRLAALATTLVAAIVIGTAKQTTTVNIPVSPTLPPLPVTAAAKAAYASAFVYFLVANVMACIYSAISLAMSTMKRVSKYNLSLSLSMVDAAMVALLYSGNGAALTFGLLGKYGNSHVQWQKICNVFEKFCLSVTVAIIFSLLGSLAYMFIVLLGIISLHKRSP